MPLDFTMLLGTSPPTSAFMPSSVSYEKIQTFDPDFPPPYACKRAASFPLVNRHSVKPSSMAIRSMSETDVLNKKNDQLTLVDLKRELANLVIHEQEEDGPKGMKASRTKPKKKVSFADEYGAQLFAVKVMTEPSDVPPKLDLSLIQSLLGLATLEEAKPASTWVVNFPQPACEYLEFRKTIDAQNVGLENVLVKNDQCKLVGTVKVKNIAFEKSVFIRFTENNWQSYRDADAKYVQGPADIYDTFSFDFEIPCDDANRQRILFCVCYKTGEREFWDSNKGANFEIISEQLREEQLSPKTPSFSRLRPRQCPGSQTDAYLMESGSHWGGFSSWKDLCTTGPYY